MAKEYYKVGNSVREKTIDEDTEKILDDRLICVVRNTEDEEELTNRICRALQADYNAEMTTRKVQRSKSIDYALSSALTVLQSPYIFICPKNEQLVEQAK